MYESPSHEKTILWMMNKSFKCERLVYENGGKRNKRDGAAYKAKRKTFLNIVIIYSI